MSPFKGRDLRLTEIVWHSTLCPFLSDKYLYERCSTHKMKIQQLYDTKLTLLPGNV